MALDTPNVPPLMVIIGLFGMAPAPININMPPLMVVLLW